MAEPDGVSMPPAGTGERRRRRERRRRARQRVLLTGAGVLAVVVLVVAGVAWSRGDSGGGEPAGGPAAAEASPAPAAPVPEPVLLAQQGEAGELVALTVLVPEPAGPGGGHVVFVPVGTMVEVPSFGLDTLRRAWTDGGLALVQQSLENLLGVGVAGVGAVDAESLTQLVRPAGALTVDVPDRVQVVGPSGRVEVVVEAGPNPVAPDEVGELLTVVGEEGDLARLVRHQAFWEAWLEAIASAPGDAAPTSGVAQGVVDAVVELAAGPVTFHLLPVSSVATGAGGDGEVFSVRTAELDTLLARVLPGAAADGDRVRVQVLNGTGEPAVAQLVQPVLTAAGAELAISGNANSFDHEVTQVVYYRDDDLASARALRDALGVGEVVKSLTKLDVVDVTIVVGTDLTGGGASRSADEEGAMRPTQDRDASRPTEEGSTTADRPR